MTAYAIVTVNPWHEAIVDWLLLNPDKHLREAAEYFCVTPSWLSQVMRSDAFKEYKAQRFLEHQERVSEVVIGRVDKLLEASMNTLTSRIEKEKDTVDLELLRSVTELGLKAVGMVDRRQAAPISNGAAAIINVTVGDKTPKSILEQAREDLRRLRSQNTLNMEDVEEITLETVESSAGPQLPLAEGKTDE